ncbi:MAG: O-antigen ligase family protein [bacterium]
MLSSWEKLKTRKIWMSSIFSALCFPEIIFAIFIAPTKYTFIRQTYLPFLPSPLIIFYIIIIFLITLQIFQKGKLPHIPLTLLLPYFILACIIALSLIYTSNLEYGKIKCLEFMMYSTLALFAPFFLFRGLNNINRFIYTLLVMGIFLFIILFISNPYLLTRTFSTIFGSNYLLIQHISGMAVLIICYYFLLKNQPLKKQIIWVFLLVILIMAITYPGGKAAVFTLLITTIIIAIPSIKFKNKFKIMNKRLLIIPLIIFIIECGTVGYFHFVMKFSALTGRLGAISSPQHYNRIERVENAKVALKLFSQYPLSGVGIGGFSVYSYKLEGIERFKYPHNILLEALAELGLIGFISLSLILFFAFKNLIYLQKIYKYSLLPGVFMSIFIFTFLNSLTSQDITNLALFAFIGCSYAIEHSLKDEKECEG